MPSVIFSQFNPASIQLSAIQFFQCTLHITVWCKFHNPVYHQEKNKTFQRNWKSRKNKFGLFSICWFTAWCFIFWKVIFNVVKKKIWYSLSHPYLSHLLKHYLNPHLQWDGRKSRKFHIPAPAEAIPFNPPLNCILKLSKNRNILAGSPALFRFLTVNRKIPLSFCFPKKNPKQPNKN